MKLLTADKDPNFLNRLEARSHVVAPCDALDHVARVAEIVNAPRATAVIIDPTTGKDIAEPNPFHNPKSLDKEQGYCPSSIRPLNPKPVILKNRKGKEFATEKPFFWNEVTGQREYEDKRQPARRIASDAQGNPLTFATKPGSPRSGKSAPL